MRTLAPLVLGCALAVISTACEDDPATGGGAGTGGTSAGSGGSGGGAGGTSGGAGGTSGGAGGTSGGAGGASGGTGGTGGEPVAGTPCDMPCEAGQVCEYVQVQCVRAPCPPLPTCVDDTGGGGSNACAEQGQKCDADTTCCDGLTCCSGVPVPAGEEFCGATCPRSDRNLKRDFAEVAPSDVLDALEELPISTWRYRDEPAGVKHIGPMAQDFKARFRVGTDERYIATGDADGVALAAIKALNEKLERLEAEQLLLRTENRALRQELEQLRAVTPAAR